jgi:hypothetical protein
MASRLGIEQATPRAASHASPPTSQAGRWAGGLAAPLVVSVLMAVWLLSGVSIGDALRFTGYEALYVLFPGCLLYVLLSPRSGGRLRMLAIGWPLGYALEIGAFALTAMLHVRGVFAFLPLITALTIGPPVLYRRHREGIAALPVRSLLPGRSPYPGRGVHDSPDMPAAGPPGRGRGVEHLVAALAIAVALALLAVRFFAIYPLPEHASSVYYFVDNVAYLSIAAEALHHWPIKEPFLVGHPFRYYTGAFIHMAAIKQVTGISLATTIFRLLPATAALVAALQFWCLGGLLGRSRWAGPLTVALLIVVENIKLYPTHTKAFGVALFSEFTWSPSYAFGVIFFLGLLILLQSQFLDGRMADSSSRSMHAGLVKPQVLGSLAMLGVLVLGGGATKTPAMAPFVGGLGLFWLWRLVVAKMDRLLAYCLCVSLVCLGAIYLLLLAGARDAATTEIGLKPLDFLKYTVFASTLVSHPGLLPLMGAAVVIGLWKLLPVLGALWPLHRRHVWPPYVQLALAIFLVGFTAYVTLGGPYDNENYFIWYGYIAIIPIATICLMHLWGELSKGARSAILRACAITFVLGLVAAGATQALTVGGPLARAPHVYKYLWYVVMLGLVGGLVVLWSARLDLRIGSRASSRGVRLAAYCALILGVLGCADSITLAVPSALTVMRYRQVVPRDSKIHPGMTAALYRGLVWVREHTSECDILAVNTHEVMGANGGLPEVDSGYFYYSAFTERRFIFESWIFTAKGAHNEQPYPSLYALNSAATLRGSRSAVRMLARRGVSYILIDKTHGGDIRESASVSRLVFSNSALDVYRMTVPVGRHSC